jgi:FtsP/CotA-like multicopper oxidase with cupredoxin domain
MSVVARIRSRRIRMAVAGAATAALLLPLGWLWQASRLPDSYSMMDMGYADDGRPTQHAGHGQTATGRSVTSLIADPQRPADIAVTLTARTQRFRLPSGRFVDGYTLNGQSPGPVVRATVGQLVQVRLVNESVARGVTLHWHGVDVPNAADGVAGVTQDAVGVGEAFTYRFVADRVGTFWYHSHQVSHEQVRRGLLGALVNGREGDYAVEVPPGAPGRVRVINTDSGPMSVWVAGASFRVVAVDGMDVNGPSLIRDTSVLVTAGGRADLEVSTPVRIHLGGSAAVVLGSTSHRARTVARPAATLDLLSYGATAPLDFDPQTPDRSFQYNIGRRPGFLDGRPGLWWTVNGHLFPDVPMFMVAEGDVARMRISNSSGDVHPMHLHGHHAVVLSRNGVRATGSPWWVDSLDVGNGESYDIAFVADNPGIWMDHCHNLPHSAEGLVAHLMYEGVTTPFTVRGPAGNEPE